MAKRKPVAEMPLRLEWRSPAELAENPRNWRTHPEAQVSALTDVIADVGWAGACLYNEATGRLIDGHARKKVALAQGSERIPVLVGSWTEAQEATILATLDPIGALATADAGKLDALLREVQTGSAAVQAMLDALKSENPLPLPEAGGGGDEFDTTPEAGPTRCKAGDLWVIGGVHRLLCGDSTKAEDVARVMGVERAGCVLTDPPYGIDLQNHAPGKERRDRSFEIAGDKTQEAGIAALALCQDWPRVVFANPMKPWPGEWKQHLVWDKGGAVGGGGDMGTYWKMTWELIQIAGTAKLNGARDNAVLVYNVTGSMFELHPAQKPVALIAYLIDKTTAVCGLVADWFLGSGTTLIAAHRLNRRCFGIELEPRYCDVVLKRAEAEGLTCELSEPAPSV